MKNKIDYRVIEALLNPEYFCSLAKEYGEGDPVKGSRAAWIEIRSIIRRWIRAARRDKGQDLSAALLFKHLGAIGNYQPVIEVKGEPWREVASICWSSPAPFYGSINIDIDNISKVDLDCIFIIAVCRALKKNIFVNRAYLDGRVWQRCSNEIMLNFELGNRMYSVVIDASDKNIKWVKRRIKRAIYSAKKTFKHELEWLGSNLTKQWLKHGFISSPAGAMISLMSNYDIEEGYPTLVPGNGIPIALCLCKSKDNIKIGGVFDHRVIDGRIEGRFLKSIREEMENENTFNRR